MKFWNFTVHGCQVTGLQTRLVDFMDFQVFSKIMKKITEKLPFLKSLNMKFWNVTVHGCQVTGLQTLLAEILC